MELNLNSFLLVIFKNDTRKVDCILNYLKQETEFVEILSNLDEREFFFLIDQADSSCTYSAIINPLGIAIIVSIFIILSMMVGICLGIIRLDRR